MLDWTRMSDTDRIAEAKRRQSRRDAGLPLEETPAEAKARTQEEDHRREIEIQREIRRLFLAHGFRVCWLSQARRSKQTAGIADLWVTHRGRGIAFWFEVKAEGGEQSEAQHEFELDCIATNTTYVLGGYATAENYLREMGVLKE